MVASKKAFHVLGLNADTAVSLVPLMNNDVRLGVNALLLPLLPEPKTAATSASVTPFEPRNAGVPHCATTERITGAPASSMPASAAAEIVCGRLMRRQVVFGLTMTPLANE